MANTVKLKRSATPGAVPTTAQLALGELAMNTYDGKVYMVQDNGTQSVIQVGGAGGSGTVTSVSALTLGTTGTDLSSTVANGTTTPVITLNVPTASSSNRGALSSSDWTTFNGKVGTSDFVTLTNKRITPRIDTITSASTITPTSDVSDQYNVTALATTASFAIPSGSPTDGQKLSIRILASTTQTISWVTTTGGYRVIGTTLPTSAPAGKIIYVGCVYNAADSFWDVVAVSTQA